jgi:hypothetical protein
MLYCCQFGMSDDEYALWVEKLSSLSNPSERPVGRGWLAILARPRLSIRVSHLMPRVLIVVTVETHQLPVAPVGWIVIVVMVLVTD